MTRPQDLELVYRRLEGAYEAIPGLWVQARDLHDQAFLRYVGDFEHVSGGAEHPGVETVGDQWAKTLWSRLCATAIDLDTLRPLKVSINNYFMAGRGADPDHRGPLQSHGEFEKSLRNQRKQASAGKYVPARLVEQPPYPRMGR